MRGEADKEERRRYQQIQIELPRSGLTSVDHAARVLELKLTED